MTKRLWQAIGIENNNSSLCDFSEYSTIRVEEGPPAGPNDISEQIRLFASEPLKKSRFQNGRKQELRNTEIDGALNIESCDSQQANIDQQSPKFYRTQSGNEKLRSRLKILQRQFFELKENHQSLKLYLQVAASKFKISEAAAFQQFQQTIELVLQAQSQRWKQIIEEKQICNKCETSKKTIDSLTNQCWEVERELRQKKEENKKLQQQLLNKQNEKLREVEIGLLEERGEIIRRLKGEIQLLEEENSQLRSSFSLLEEELNDVEGEYKKHLIELKGNIEEINRLANHKHQKLIEEKVKLSLELEELNKKYEALLSQTERSERDPYTRRQQANTSIRLNNYPLKQTQKDPHTISSVSLRNYRKENPGEALPSRHYTKVNTEIISQLSLYQLPKDEEEECAPITSNSTSIKAKYQTILDKLSSKKSQVQFGLSCAQYGKKLTSSFKMNSSLKSSGSSLKGMNLSMALNSLSDLKREVRREIARAKFS